MKGQATSKGGIQGAGSWAPFRLNEWVALQLLPVPSLWVW